MKEIISIIVPCYNEEECINTFYNELNKVTKKMKVDFEILFIDDGSNDETLNIIKKLYKKDKRIRYLSFSRNFGKEAGMYAGLNYVTGDYIAFMDIDLTDPPQKLIEMYKYIKEDNYDCVALYTSNHKEYSPFRKILTNIWYKLAKKISSKKSMPGERDFRLMTKKMAEAILNMKEHNRYIKGIYTYVGFNTKWLEYEAPKREKGTSKYSMLYLFKYALNGVTTFSTKPLTIPIYLGLILFVPSLIYILFILIKSLIIGKFIYEYSLLISLIIFIGGLILYFIGIIGIYISKIYIEVKNRPEYIIKETEKDYKE